MSPWPEATTLIPPALALLAPVLLRGRSRRQEVRVPGPRA